MMLSQNENQSILIHDIKKHLQSIKLLNEKNDSDKINAYIQQLMESSDLKETSKICDNEMLNAILCRYQRQCNEKHIVFHADIRSGTVQNIYQHDLTSLFCNLLDNAVESADNIPDSFIELTVQKKGKFTFYRYHNHKFLPKHPLYMIRMDFLYPINQARADMVSESRVLKKS